MFTIAGQAYSQLDADIAIAEFTGCTWVRHECADERASDEYLYPPKPAQDLFVYPRYEPMAFRRNGRVTRYAALPSFTDDVSATLQLAQWMRVQFDCEVALLWQSSTMQRFTGRKTPFTARITGGSLTYSNPDVTLSIHSTSISLALTIAVVHIARNNHTNGTIRHAVMDAEQ